MAEFARIFSIQIFYNEWTLVFVRDCSGSIRLCFHEILTKEWKTKDRKQKTTTAPQKGYDSRIT